MRRLLFLLFLARIASADPIDEYFTRLAAHGFSGAVLVARGEEIVQETYYRFLRSRFEGASDEERRSYLYRIAVNLAKNHWSRQNQSEMPSSNLKAS
jgi:DNA-directed RNA polymerase specialized sigma24 family protein